MAIIGTKFKSQLGNIGFIGEKVDMEIHDIKKIYESSRQNDVNELLTKGWVLLGSSHGKDESGYPIIRYTLGWPKDTAPEYGRVF